jgi:hypothetical protein
MTRMRIITRTLTAAALLAATSCSSTVRTGNSPVFLVINSLQGIRGANTPGTPSAFLVSDVVTIVLQGCATPTNPPSCAQVFGDNGSVVLQVAQKDVTSTAAPTTNNQVTISRIHVHYRLADGTTPVQGTNVPFDFDTAVTSTVPASGTATIGFELVRVSAKETHPLSDLADFPFGTPCPGPLPACRGGFINGIADVTFFGTDQVGNAISVTGSIAIQFGDFTDPTS